MGFLGWLAFYFSWNNMLHPRYRGLLYREVQFHCSAFSPCQISYVVHRSGSEFVSVTHSTKSLTPRYSCKLGTMYFNCTQCTLCVLHHVQIKHQHLHASPTPNLSETHAHTLYIVIRCYQIYIRNSIYQQTK